MAADVEEVEGHVVGVDGMVAERIAAELGRGDEQPVGGEVARARLGQDRHDVVGGFGDLVVEAALRPLEEEVALGELILDRLAMLDRPGVARRFRLFSRRSRRGTRAS